MAVPILLASQNGADIDYSHRPADWPQLQKLYFYTDEGPALCGDLDCAIPRFDNGTCVLALSHNPTRQQVKHEEGHCDGHDHFGATDVADLWAAWKRDHPSASAKR